MSSLTAPVSVSHTNLGPLACGSNMFRTGVVHSSGNIYIGTYGPEPAIIWKFNPKSKALTKVAAPGEYQLDSMVEAPNGMIYIGSAYNGLVYELNPGTGTVKNLGSPPLHSTPWIFTMICTRSGEIYGAKGVGLFRLDWKSGKMTSLGLMEANHKTLGPNPSDPVIRFLEERPDGLLWCDTNRWIFTFNPKTGEIKKIADMTSLEPSCYALFHNLGYSPVQELYFLVYSRFSGQMPRHAFWMGTEGGVKPFPMKGLSGYCHPAGWWKKNGKWHWLMVHQNKVSKKSSVAVIDIEKKRVMERWKIEGNDMPPVRLQGPGLWFISIGKGTLYMAVPSRKRLKIMVENPEPVESRNLAVSGRGKLGTHAYDCGFMFTWDSKKGKSEDHGRVNVDDHRCNYGPSVFAGKDDRYFLANNGEALPSLYVTDLRTNAHWSVGAPAVQLIRLRSGLVWGTQGVSIPTYRFDAARSWIYGRHSVPGKLFSYQPGARRVEIHSDLNPVGSVAEGFQKDCLFLSCKNVVSHYDAKKRKVFDQYTLHAEVKAAISDLSTRMIYLVLSDASLAGLHFQPDGSVRQMSLTECFGLAERGFLIAPKSRRVIGIALNGRLSVYDPVKKSFSEINSKLPLAAGPAVDSKLDRWYFADRFCESYELK